MQRIFVLNDSIKVLDRALTFQAIFRHDYLNVNFISLIRPFTYLPVCGSTF